MKKQYTIQLQMQVTLEREDGDAEFPKVLPSGMVKVILDNLNISDETNDMFMDSMQEYTDLSVHSFYFCEEK